VSKGIQARHARKCPARRENGGGDCKCTPSWQAEVYDARVGRKIRQTFSNRTAANYWRQDAYAALRSGKLSADRGLRLDDAFERFFADMRARHVRNRSGDPFKPSAIRGYEQNWRLRGSPKLGHCRLRELTTQDVQKWIEGLAREGLAPATLDTALTPLRALYRYAVVRGDATNNPTRGILKPAVRCAPKNIVTATQATELLAAVDAADRPLWATAIYAGLRRGELVGLLPKDVDLATGKIQVRRGWDVIEGEIAPKSRQGRRDVPIPLVLRDYLGEHLMDHDGGRVFGSFGKVRTQGERARKRWKDAGLSTLTFHESRHTYASFMIAAGVNAKALCTFMGHANIKITFDLYGHLFPGSEVEAAGLLDTYLAREAERSTGAPTGAHPSEAAC
jgi:integrase